MNAFAFYIQPKIQIKNESEIVTGSKNIDLLHKHTFSD